MSWGGRGIGPSEERASHRRRRGSLSGEFAAQLPRRHRVGRVWFLFFLSATIIGIIALIALLYTIIVRVDRPGGYREQDRRRTLAVAGVPLEQLDKAQLTAILENETSARSCVAIESEQPSAERSRDNLYALTMERVVQPNLVGAVSLIESIFDRKSIEAKVSRNTPTPS